MAEKIEKSIPWLAILAICIMVVFGIGIVLNEIVADVITPSVTVGNVPPTVETPTLNGGIDITIIENTVVAVTGTTTFSDNNGYSDVTAVTSTLYLNNTTCDSALDNANWCYADWVSCATSDCVGLTCVASCTARVWFVAEPSDASGSYATKVWRMDITVVDTANNADTGTTSQELISAYYLDITGSIGYGTVSPGATSTPEQITDATNTGNSAIDPELYGEDMETGGSTSSIAVGQQKYSSSSDMDDWVGTALSTTPNTYNLDLPKPTATTSNSTDDLYWMIKIPTSTLPGTYTGTNTVGAASAI